MMWDPSRATMSEVFAHDPGTDLRTCPPIEPLAGQRTIMARALTTARQLGLTIPEKVRWHYVSSRGRGVMQPGQTTCYLDGRVEIHLEVDVALPDDLYRTTLHELQHVHDFATGAWHTLTPAAREWKAIDFAARAMGLQR